MSFDDIPEDHKPSYPCPECDEGNVTESDDFGGVWECDTCEFSIIQSRQQKSKPLTKPTLTIHYQDGVETTVTPIPMWQP